MEGNKLWTTPATRDPHGPGIKEAGCLVVKIMRVETKALGFTSGCQWWEVCISCTSNVPICSDNSTPGNKLQK